MSAKQARGRFSDFLSAKLRKNVDTAKQFCRINVIFVNNVNDINDKANGIAE